MANKTPVKAIFSGSDVTSLGEFASGDTIAASFINGTALTLAGGAMTGAITTNSTFDGVDIATRDAILTSTTTTAGAALPKAGGTMTGNLAHAGDFTIDAGGDITLDADGADIKLKDAGTLFGSLVNASGDFKIVTEVADKDLIFRGNDGGSFITAMTIDMSEMGKVLITNSAATGTSTGNANSSTETLNFNSKQNHVLTLGTNITLVNPTTETVGQSGFIAFIQDGTGSRTVSLGTDFETAGAAGLTLTATAGATDLVPYVVVAANRILLGTPQLAFA